MACFNAVAWNINVLRLKSKHHRTLVREDMRTDETRPACSMLFIVVYSMFFSPFYLKTARYCFISRGLWWHDWRMFFFFSRPISNACLYSVFFFYLRLAFTVWFLFVVMISFLIFIKRSVVSLSLGLFMLHVHFVYFFPQFMVCSVLINK